RLQFERDAAAEVHAVGDRSEHVLTSGEVSRQRLRSDPVRAGERDDQDLLRVEAQRALLPGLQRQDVQTRVLPSRLPGADAEGIGRGLEGAGGAMPAHMLPPWTISTAWSVARSTSPSAGKRRLRPATRPRTLGISIARFHDASRASVSFPGSPPRSRPGRVVAAIIFSGSEAAGSFNQV